MTRISKSNEVSNGCREPTFKRSKRRSSVTHKESPYLIRSELFVDDSSYLITVIEEVKEGTNEKKQDKVFASVQNSSS